MKRDVIIGWVLSLVSLLGGCAASDKMEATMEKSVHSVVDKMPDWAGGPTKGLPPRPTDPGYAAYKQQLEGKAAPAPKPATDQPAPARSSDTPDHQTTGQ